MKIDHVELHHLLFEYPPGKRFLCGNGFCSARLTTVVEVHTAWQYVQKCISEWMAGWKRPTWRISEGKQVKNQDLWLQLDALSQLHRIEWKWVRGHNGHPENERADELANEGVLQAPQP